MKVGFPRPRDDRFALPVPFTAAGLNMIGAGSDERIERCVVEGLCGVCGLELQETCCVAVQQTGPYSGYVSCYDPGLMHEKCAEIARAFCPHFRDGDASLELVDTAHALSLLRNRGSQNRILVG